MFEILIKKKFWFFIIMDNEIRRLCSNIYYICFINVKIYDYIYVCICVIYVI